MACPDPRLDDLASWMREHGATYARIGDIELELCAAPAQQSEPTREDPDEASKRLRAEMRDELRTRYAHVGHEPTDEEVEQALRDGGWTQ